MSQILELFKLQLDNKYDIFKKKDFKSFFKSFFKYLVLTVAIILVMFLILRKIFFLLFINVNPSLMTLVLIATQAISFIFAVGSIMNTLYFSKDNELFMVMPVTFNQLFISKIMMIYINELIFNFVYMLPILFTFGLLGHFSVIYFLLLFVFIPILPVLPIALASLISIPFMFIVKFFKKNIWLTIITILILVAGMFVLYMQLVSKISGAINIAEKQVSTGLRINREVEKLGSNVFIFSKLAISLVKFQNIYNIFLYLIGSFVLFMLCFLVIKPFYYKVATITLENTTSPKRKPKKFKARKPFNELLLNEIKLTFRSPSYIFQFFLFPVFMPLIVFTYDKLLITIAVNQAGQNMIFGSHILILLIIALMSNIISSIAISKEGSTFYLTKVSPIDFKLQVLAKLFFNAIFTIGAIIITTITTLLFTNLRVEIVFLSAFLVIILSLGHICHSFDMDLQNPILDWYDNSEISALSKSTTKSMVYALVLSLIMFVLTTLGGVTGLIFGVGMSVMYLLARIHLLKIRIYYYFNTMEVWYEESNYINFTCVTIFAYILHIIHWSNFIKIQLSSSWKNSALRW